MKAIIKDNMALEKGKQSALMKSVKRVKKVKKPETDPLSLSRGIIMLNHVPHGFFEKEMRGYFSQFGKVLRVRLARSKKTGKSRGYAYVEFEFREVAQIAAEAMNNYLMYERLIKCELLPTTANPKKIFRDKYITAEKYPKLIARKKRIAEEDTQLSEEESKTIIQQRLNSVQERNKKLAEMGIDYQFDLKVKEKAVTKSPTTTPAKDPAQKVKAITPRLSDLSQISPKMSRNSNSKVETVKKTSTPSKEFAQKAAKPRLSDLPKISPKMSRIEVVKETISTTPAKEFAQKAAKPRLSDLPKISPKMLRSRKSEAVKDATPAKELLQKTPKQKRLSELPKISPKMLRSRKSEGFKAAPTTISTPAKEATKPRRLSEMPKISPKMLRSRKSEVIKEAPTPSKQKKGRKSVF